MLKQLQPGELANTITHGVGAVLSIVAGAYLLTNAADNPDVWRMAGCLVFALALLAVYAVSTLSHAVGHPRLRHLFRSLDQGCIYLLIAGTYTPFALAYLRFGWWWVFLGVMWAIAIVGFLSKVVLSHRVDAIAVWSYLLLGWMTLVPVFGSHGALPLPVIGWVFAGGLCYTVGTVFLMVDYQRLHFHAIWHLWVLGGSTCHFLGVLLFVARFTSYQG